MGRAFAGTEIGIADDGEILTRGPLNTPGYLNRPDLTAELIDADGWLHTGDIGRLDDDGFLSVVDRKKELIITAGGENVPPAVIENLLVAHPLIGQALAYGDRRPYVVALLTLDAEVAPAWARARGIEAGSLAGAGRRTPWCWPRSRRPWPRPTSSWPGCSRSSAGGCCRWSGPRRARS